MSYLKSAPSTLSKCKVPCYRKTNFGPKLLYLEIFGREYEKTIVIFQIRAPSNLSKCKVSCKTKKAMGLGPAMRFYLSTFKPEFDKAIVILEISSFEFFKLQNFTLKKKK